MNAIHHLLQLVDAYRAARQLSDARVSTLVFNDGSKVKTLREGRDIGVRTAMRAVQWFSDNWPEGAEWPEDVERPLTAPSIPDDSGFASAQHVGE